MTTKKPEIMAPAGDRDAFLAAVAAGADAVYLGLKHFSARMQAKNFSISELSRLANLARDKGTRVFIAMNTLVKPGDLESAGSLIRRAAQAVQPDALIVADLSLGKLARQAGFKGELHCSTLANLSHPAGLKMAADLGFNRVVIPRELNLDEVKTMAEACPDGLDLEMFVHGALCWSVSGRCWWSSFFGGKSGLRGRCVQPCRRMYRQGGAKGKADRLFSCMDLSLDVLTKPLLDIPQIGAWKIEGRKKGPHYVFYTVKAYKLLRDEPTGEGKKAAQSLLDQALGRPRTHSVFLPQRPFMPVAPGQETASGQFIGQVQGGAKKPHFITREPLLPGDLLRIGYEDEPGHRTLPIRKRIPKRGRVDIPFAKGPRPTKDMRVSLIDRREPELMRLIRDLAKEADKLPATESAERTFTPTLPRPVKPGRRTDILVTRSRVKGKPRGEAGLWLSPHTLEGVPKAVAAKTWWWLPPVIWPDEEDRTREMIERIAAAGAKTFVLGSPWQAALVPAGKQLVAGPFCNLANALSLQVVKDIGCEAAFVSPELAGEDFLALPRQSPLPLGVVLKGSWPLGVSRVLGEGVKLDTPILSPKDEAAWVRKYGQNYWVFAGWEMDIAMHRRELERAGYSLFATMTERWPKGMRPADRPGTFNWDLTLL